MQPAELRFRILELMKRHEATGDSAYLDDSIIAADLGLPVQDIKDQLEILANRGLVTLGNTFGVHSGRLTASGKEALESAAQEPNPAKRRIGF
jgi:predicted ArsR family transcriptional regulator